MHGEDGVSYGRNLEQLKSELAKPKPRPEVLKDYMCRTFPNRWDSFINNNDPGTLLGYIGQFPLLKKTTYVSESQMIVFISYTLMYVQAALDFAFACKKDDIRDEFEDKFHDWAKAVIKYCKDTQVRSTALQAETAAYNEAISEGTSATYISI